MTEVIENTASVLLPLNFEELVDQITDRIDSQKKVNRKKDEIKEVVRDMVSYYNYFNSFNQFNLSCFTEIIEISEIPVLNEFKELIYPASIKRIAGSYLCEDVLIRTRIDRNKVYSFNEYMNIINKIRSYTKRDAFSEVTKLSDLKLEVSIDAILPKASWNGKVRVNDNWFYPIPISTRNDYSDLYFNTTSKECAMNYFSLLKVN